MPFVYVAIFLQGQNGFIKILLKYSVRIFLLSSYIVLVNNVFLLFNDQMAFFFFLNWLEKPKFSGGQNLFYVFNATEP